MLKTKSVYSPIELAEDEAHCHRHLLKALLE